MTPTIEKTTAQTTTEVVVSVDHIRVRYGDTLAVDDVSLSINRGEIFGILGPNGAGKTTTVEAIGGLRRPDSGAISVLGLDALEHRQALRRRVGIQLQTSELPDKLRVGEAHRDLRFHPGRPPGGGTVSNPIRVMIVDDHPVVRNGLSGMFQGDPEFEVVGEAGDGSQAVRRARTLSPDVILMDLRMPEMDGVSAIGALAAAGVPARVLVLTTYDTDGDVLAAIEAGATGYLLKDAPPAELFRAVRAAANGEAVLSPSVATRVVGQMRAPAEEPISQRELEVLELVAQGASNRDAAARLFISEATVKTHLMHIYAKLGVNDRAAAVAEAFNRGLLIPRHTR